MKNYPDQFELSSPSIEEYPLIPDDSTTTHGYFPGEVITTQPVGQRLLHSGWITESRRVSNCPPGLEYLTKINQLYVHQEMELLEVFTRFETKNRYIIRNSLGQTIYYAGEVTNCCIRNCCGSLQPFEIKILDSTGNEVINLHRPLTCSYSCCPCWLPNMVVTSPPGTLAGTIEQEWSILFPSFVVKNSNEDAILRIKGPLFTCSCCCQDVEFIVSAADGASEVGKISKQWSGLDKEVFTDEDNFCITFSKDIDVRMKATLLGACFLIDIMYFEGCLVKSNPGI